MPIVRAVGIVIGAAALLSALPASAQVTQLAQNSAGTNNGPRFYGQSFLVTGSGAYTNIQFSFLDQAGGNVANGILYVFDHDCSATCSPANLSSQAGGTASQAAVNDSYSFGSSLTLNAGQTYYAYSDTAQTVAYDAVNNPYGDGQAYQRQAAAPGVAYNSSGTLTDTSFRVTGVQVAAAPEPASWALMIVGCGVAGTALRRQKRARREGSPTALPA